MPHWASQAEVWHQGLLPPWALSMAFDCISPLGGMRYPRAGDWFSQLDWEMRTMRYAWHVHQLYKDWSNKFADYTSLIVWMYSKDAGEVLPHEVYLSSQALALQDSYG